MKIFLTNSEDNPWVSLTPWNDTAQSQCELRIEPGPHPGDFLGTRHQPLPLALFHMHASRVPGSASSPSLCQCLPVDLVFSCRRVSLLLFMRVEQRHNFRAVRNLRKMSSNFPPSLYTELERWSHLSGSSLLVRGRARINSWSPNIEVRVIFPWNIHAFLKGASPNDNYHLRELVGGSYNTYVVSKIWGSFQATKNRSEKKYIFICKIEFIGGSVIYMHNTDQD